MGSWKLVNIMALVLGVLSVGPPSYAFEIDESCFKIYPNLKPEVVQSTFAHNMSLAQSSVTWCEYRYPELKPYLAQWRQNTQELLITCKKSSTEDGIAEGQAAAATYPKLKLVYSRPKITIYTGSIGELFTKRLPSIAEYEVYGLTHEIFHTTAANNIGANEHNTLEATEPSYSGWGCDARDVTLDRIEMVTSICSGRSPVRGDLAGEVEIFKKSAKCGLKKSCIDLFRSEIPGSYFGLDNLYNRNQGLTEEKAKSLCARIQLRGACLARESGNFSNAELLTYLETHPGLKKMALEIQAALSNVLATDPDKVSYDLLKRVPALQSGYESLRESVCFKELTETDKSGIKYMYMARDISNSDPRKCAPTTRQAVRNWFESVNKLALSPLQTLQHFSAHRSLASYEDINSALSSYVAKQLLGQAKVAEYKDLLSSHYPGSPNKSCKNFADEDLKALLPFFDDVSGTVQLNPRQYCPWK
jgi:hypothetical protein